MLKRLREVADLEYRRADAISFMFWVIERACQPESNPLEVEFNDESIRLAIKKVKHLMEAK